MRAFILLMCFGASVTASTLTNATTDDDALVLEGREICAFAVPSGWRRDATANVPDGFLMSYGKGASQADHGLVIAVGFMSVASDRPCRTAQCLLARELKEGATGAGVIWSIVGQIRTRSGDVAHLARFADPQESVFADLAYVDAAGGIVVIELFATTSSARDAHRGDFEEVVRSVRCGTIGSATSAPLPN